MQFSSLSVDVFSPPYYLVDLCCSIDNVSEIVSYSVFMLISIYLYCTPYSLIK